MVSLSSAPITTAADPAQIVVLVRHAEKALAPDDDVGLSEAGRARAEALAQALAGLRPEAIVISQFRRTRETAAPLADSQTLTPIVVPTESDTAAHARRVADVVRTAGRAVVVVGHSNTVPLIIRALGGPALPEICDTEYAHVFTLLRVPGEPARLMQSTYGAADPPPAPDCGRTMKQD